MPLWTIIESIARSYFSVLLQCVSLIYPDFLIEILIFFTVCPDFFYWMVDRYEFYNQAPIFPDISSRFALKLVSGSFGRYCVLVL